MKAYRRTAGTRTVLAAIAAAMLLPAPASAQDKPGTGTKPPATAPADKKPADAKPAEKKPADAKAPAKPAEPKPAPAPSAPPGPGMWGSMNDFMIRTKKKVDDATIFGLKPRISLSDTLAYTDNAFYQDSNEQLVVDRNPDRISADDDADNDGDPKAHPHLGPPRGEVAELVNSASLTVGLELPLNLALVPMIGEGKNSIRLFNGSVTSVEYLKHSDSPDAVNWQVGVDFPILINTFLSKMKVISGGGDNFYVRVEGDMNHVTDPLDVAVFGFSSSAPPTFFRTGERNDFERQEWFLKGTLGWKGPRFDAKGSYKHYNFDIRDDETLDSADHVQNSLHGDVGYSIKSSEHRVYGFYDYTTYDFQDRGDAQGFVPPLRDFSRTRAGFGIEGPVYTKKLRGMLELAYHGMEVFHDPGIYKQPFAIDLETGRVLVGPNGNPIRRPLEEFAGFSPAARLVYRPFSTKGTQIQADYSRTIDWSVVAQAKLIDKGSLSFVHPLNEKWTAQLKYEVSFENVPYREKRLYQELGAGATYKLMAHTDLDFRYTIRCMRSRREPATQFADPGNEPFLIKPDGDFFANILSVGLTVSF